MQPGADGVTARPLGHRWVNYHPSPQISQTCLLLRSMLPWSTPAAVTVADSGRGVSCSMRRIRRRGVLARMMGILRILRGGARPLDGVVKLTCSLRRWRHDSTSGARSPARPQLQKARAGVALLPLSTVRVSGWVNLTTPDNRHPVRKPPEPAAAFPLRTPPGSPHSRRHSTHPIGSGASRLARSARPTR
jgi:hypothetical protein